MHETPQTTNVLSDSKGRFSLKGVEGATLSVDVGKEGYDTDGLHQGPFWYTEAIGDDRSHHPDPNEPIVFHLRKKG